MTLEYDPNQEDKNHPKIPKDQWDLPIGFMPNGIPITLNNYKDVGIHTITKKLNERNIDLVEIKELVLNRLKKVKNYGAFSFNKERVDREIAIKEVEKGTPLGDYSLPN